MRGLGGTARRAEEPQYQCQTLKALLEDLLFSIFFSCFTHLSDIDSYIGALCHEVFRETPRGRPLTLLFHFQIDNFKQLVE